MIAAKPERCRPSRRLSGRSTVDVPSVAG